MLMLQLHDYAHRVIVERKKLCRVSGGGVSQRRQSEKSR
jgi:hypothetical protein